MIHLTGSGEFLYSNQRIKQNKLKIEKPSIQVDEMADVVLEFFNGN